MEAQVGLKEQRRKLPSRRTDSVFVIGVLETLVWLKYSKGCNGAKQLNICGKRKYFGTELFPPLKTSALITIKLFENEKSKY